MNLRNGICVLCLVLLALPGIAAAEEATFRFSWEGGGGYRMEGAISFDNTQRPALIREGDVTCFEIAGFLDDAPLGRWTLSSLTPQTVWRLHFLPQLSRFLVEGEGISMPQAWNMDGSGRGCGLGGFGFNLGNVAQDLCVNDELLIDSQLNPFAPFPATRDDTHQFGPGACEGEILLGRLSDTLMPLAHDD